MSITFVGPPAAITDAIRSPEMGRMSSSLYLLAPLPPNPPALSSTVVVVLLLLLLVDDGLVDGATPGTNTKALLLEATVVVLLLELPRLRRAEVS